MKKLILCVLMLVMFNGISYATTVSVDPFVSGNDVTINHLEQLRVNVLNALNSFDGANIQTGSITYAKLDDSTNPVIRWNETFSDFVVSGLIPSTTTGTLLSTTSAGTADISGVRVTKASTDNTYTATKWTFVDLSSTGTYTYTEATIGNADPAIASNTIRLARVSTDASQITAIRDDRNLSPNFSTGSGASESSERRDLFISSVTTPDTIVICPGYIYHGTTRISKTTNTTLNIGTATDWATAVSGRATSTYGYIVISSAGSIKLTTTFPTLVDTTGNTTGVVRYSNIGGAYWRCLGWFYMNGTGSGNLQKHSWGNHPDGGLTNFTYISADSNVSTTSNSFVDISDMSVYFVSFGRPIHYKFIAPVYGSADDSVDAQIINDTITKVAKRLMIPGSAVSTSQEFNLDMVDYSESAGTHTIKAQWKVDAGTMSQTGTIDAQDKCEGIRCLYIEEKQ